MTHSKQNSVSDGCRLNPETTDVTKVMQSELMEQMSGLVPRYPLQKPPSRGLEGSGGRGGGDEGLKVEEGFTFGRLQGGFKGASRGLHLRKASRGLEGGFKGASRALEGGLKPSEGEGGFEGLEGGLKGASRGLEGGFTFGRLHAPFKPPSSPLQAPSSEGEAPLKPSEGEAPFKPS